MKTIKITLASTFAILTFAVVAATGGQPRPPAPAGGKPPAVGAKPAAAKPAAAKPAAKPAGAKGKVQPGRGGQRPAVGGDRRGGPRRGEGHHSREDERLISAIEDAESYGQLVRLYDAARASRDSEVRMAMVSALEDQGAKAANSLVPFIADPDEDVADSAFSAWTSILEDMPAHRRLSAICAAAQGAVPPPPPQPVLVPVQ